MWVGLCDNGRIIGPHLFNRNVNGRMYGEMLQNVVFPSVAFNYQSYGPVFNGLRVRHICGGFKTELHHTIHLRYGEF